MLHRRPTPFRPERCQPPPLQVVAQLLGLEEGPAAYAAVEQLLLQAAQCGMTARVARTAPLMELQRSRRAAAAPPALPATPGAAVLSLAAAGAAPAAAVGAGDDDGSGTTTQAMDYESTGARAWHPVSACQSAGLVGSLPVLRFARALGC